MGVCEGAYQRKPIYGFISHFFHRVISEVVPHFLIQYFATLLNHTLAHQAKSCANLNKCVFEVKIYYKKDTLKFFEYFEEFLLKFRMSDFLNAVVCHSC